MARVASTDRVESALLAAARDRMPLHDGIADPAPGVVRRAPAGWKDEVMIGDTRVLLTVDERGLRTNVVFRRPGETWSPYVTAMRGHDSQHRLGADVMDAAGKPNSSL
jgi:hypothetical protein